MMNELTIKGKITFVDEVREFGSNGFRKHQVVVETGDGRWDNPIPVEFTKDSIELSKELKVGDQVQIQTRINGREWQGKDGVTKWFTSINGYKITKENPQNAEDPSSSFDTFDEYADDLEEDVF
jgi:single-stranded DNA-binding protein